MPVADIPSSTRVRVMRPDEFDEMRGVAVEAFGGNPLIGTLIDELRASWAWDDDLAFVAERGDELVGQVLYSHALLDTPTRVVGVLVLSPVGVRTDLQHGGIGARLMTESIAALQDRDEPVVFLEGNPGYYPRFGFGRGDHQGFVSPSDRIPAAAFMALPLQGYEPWMTGTLVYSDACWQADEEQPDEEQPGRS